MDWYPATLWLLGASLWLVTVYDFIPTVLTVTGSGRISGRLQSEAWRGLLAIHRRKPIHKQLSRAGPVFALSALFVWTVLLWLSWTLIFCGDPKAVVDAKTGEIASFSERAYFVGYTLTTLGLGDFKPEGTLWKIATVLAGANGLFMFTMAISYIMPVVSTTAQMRRLAAYIHRFGDTPHDIVKTSFNGRSFDSMNTHFTSLTPMIDALGQQYLAYPILHYFHSPEAGTALPVRLAVLDEALMIMVDGVDGSQRPAPQIVRPLRGAIAGFLDILHSAHIDPVREPPSIPDLQRFADCGLSIKSQTELESAGRRNSMRRRKLKSLVECDGWNWRNVWPQ